MKFKILFLTAIIFGCVSQSLAQEGQLRNVTPPIPVDTIIQRFASAETQNRVAREQNYTFTQDYDLKTIGIGGFISGEYHRVSDIVYDDHHNRLEQITFFPAPTLTEINVTPQDISDAGGIQPFALTMEDLPKYDVTYLGKEKEDELDTYVFDVKPKKIEKNQRYFEGRIWVDDHDLQIVKSKGIAVPRDAQNAYPHFESYRENIDGKYWFPTYVYADDMLEFKKSPSVHVRMVIRYTKYKKFTGNITVLNDPGDQEGEPTEKPAPKPTPAPPRKPPLN